MSQSRSAQCRVWYIFLFVCLFSVAVIDGFKHVLPGVVCTHRQCTPNGRSLHKFASHGGHVRSGKDGRLHQQSSSNSEVDNVTSLAPRPALLDSEETPLNDRASTKRPREVEWTAYKKSTIVVREKARSVEAYMALPSTEYSVLASDSIERLDERNFKARLPTMNFFGTKITPVLFVDVTVYPEDARSVIAVQRAETVGSETAEKINGTFHIEALNQVTAGTNEKNEKTLTSETNLKINVRIPESSKVPTGVLRRTGNFLMQSSLNVIVPTFIRLLAFDFKNWSGGDDGRGAVEGASLQVRNADMMTQEDN